MIEFLGVVLVLFSLPGLIKPAEVVRNAERIDVDGGSRPSTGGKPTEWKVTATRVVAGAMLLVGLVAVFV